MTQLEKILSKLTGHKIREAGSNEAGERLFLIVDEGRVMTHSELNYRFSIN